MKYQYHISNGPASEQIKSAQQKPILQSPNINRHKKWRKIKQARIYKPPITVIRIKSILRFV